MNYLKIYNQIIERAKNRQLEGYKEKHHILPKCLGGSNDKENLVELTAREHFLCHMLLCEIYPNETKLTQALWLMIIGKRRKNYQQYKISSKTYELLKIKVAEKATMPETIYTLLPYSMQGQTCWRKLAEKIKN
jgi:hypothetical protein